MEDANILYEIIKSEFGEEVANLVESCSEDKKKSWEERKKHTIDSLSQETDRNVLLLACADKLSNIRSIKADYEKVGEEIWVSLTRGKRNKNGTTKK